MANIESYCRNCKYWDEFDGCTDSCMVEYDKEQECYECEDFEEALTPYDMYLAQEDEKMRMWELKEDK